jgi:hypothetical protein
MILLFGDFSNFNGILRLVYSLYYCMKILCPETFGANIYFHDISAILCDFMRGGPGASTSPENLKLNLWLVRLLRT